MTCGRPWPIATVCGSVARSWSLNAGGGPMAASSWAGSSVGPGSSISAGVGSSVGPGSSSSAGVGSAVGVMVASASRAVCPISGLTGSSRLLPQAASSRVKIMRVRIMIMGSDKSLRNQSRILLQTRFEYRLTGFMLHYITTIRQRNRARFRCTRCFLLTPLVVCVSRHVWPARTRTPTVAHRNHPDDGQRSVCRRAALLV